MAVDVSGGGSSVIIKYSPLIVPTEDWTEDKSRRVTFSQGLGVIFLGDWG